MANIGFRSVRFMQPEDLYYCGDCSTHFVSGKKCNCVTVESAEENDEVRSEVSA